MQSTDYIVYRANSKEQIEVLAIDSSFALCENIVSEQSVDEDDLVCIIKVADANDELLSAAKAFEFSFVDVKHIDNQHGDHRGGAPTYTTYRGRINGREFEVDVNQLSPPTFNITLSDDERETILTAIENRE